MTALTRRQDEKTLKECAVRLGVSAEAARRLCHRGTITHVRRGGRIYVREAELKRLMADRAWRKFYSRRKRS